MLIFKICDRTDWEAAERTGVYAGSGKDRADGFLHFSSDAQLAGTLERHYADAGNLVLVAVEADELEEALKWEISRGGEKFPHLYSALPVSMVKWTAELQRGEDGSFVLPF